MIVVRLLFRFLLVPFAASVAICVAMLFVIAAHWNRFVALAGTNPAPPDDAAVFLLLLAPALVMSAAVVAMLAPAAIGALIAEAFAIRSWMFHIANGGLSAWTGWLMLEDVRKPYEIFNEPLIVAGAGIAAGFAYWAIAGWSAGFWKPMLEQPLGSDSTALNQTRR
jgi:hypothetical protein